MPDLYQDTLLALAKETAFRSSEKLQHPLSERRNPACGDEIALTTEQTHPQLTGLRFHAQACAITVASAVAMCKELEGLASDTARARLQEALTFFDKEGDWAANWGTDTLPALGAVRQRPMRMACVRLPWEALKEALPDGS